MTRMICPKCGELYDVRRRRGSGLTGILCPAPNCAGQLRRATDLELEAYGNSLLKSWDEKPLAVLLVAALLLSGCATFSSTLEALAKDEASDCLSVQSPYASLVVGRANRDGVKLTISGGQCTLEHTGGKP